MKNSNKKKESELGVYKSCGNVFADLGLPDAEECLAKAQLAFAIRRQIKARDVTQAEAAKLLDTDQAKVSLIMNGRVGGFTLDRLTRFLNALEMDVRIVIEPTEDHRRGRTLVAAA
jgi:predicted XRE-type DNA-binding protein